MSLSLAYSSELTATENLTIPDAPSASIKHDGFNTNLNLNGTSTPPVSQMASFNKALSGGTGTIDLTVLPGSAGTVSLNGLKVVAFKLLAPAANANPITIATGASNGYNLTGGALSITLYPGQEATFYCKSFAPLVDGTHKTIDLTGTGTQSLNIEIIGG